MSSVNGFLSIVKDVDLEIGEGELVGLVGESGSGKSITAFGLLRLLSPHVARVSGTVLYDGEDLLTAPVKRLRAVRGAEIGLVTQDALTALDPVFTVGAQMVEAIVSHRDLGRHDAIERAERLLEQVGIRDATERLRQYPHELSGGMRQRVLLAIALCNSPRLLIADEPTTALDVTIQAQLVRLLAREATTRRLAMLLITHDLRLVAGLCHKIIVMYAGRVVETGSAASVYNHPQHPYTAALLECAVGLTRRKGTRLRPIEGAPPHPAATVTGCSFAPRCPRAWDRCREERPVLYAAGPDQRAACHLHN